MEALTAAGVVFVPFDSASFTEVASIAWAGGPESGDYMEPEAIARFICLLFAYWPGHSQACFTLAGFSYAVCSCCADHAALGIMHIAVWRHGRHHKCSRICICSAQLYSEAQGMERCDQMFVGIQCNACWAAVSFMTYN